MSEEQGSSARTVMGWVVMLIWMVVLWQVVGILADPVERARFWQMAARILQQVAWRAGSAGLAAEKAYWSAMDQARSW